VYTPQAEFGDLSGLNTLPQTKLEVTSTKENLNNRSGVRISVRNPSRGIAFLVHLRITKGSKGDDLTPIFWSDNYFSLLPGEQKEVSATYDPTDLDGKGAVLEVAGYNVAAQSPELR
jgi:exo-1,4-beta-D-glucosaminidase